MPDEKPKRDSYVGCACTDDEKTLWMVTWPRYGELSAVIRALLNREAKRIGKPDRQPMFIEKKT
jgi:hypothetical protein